MSSADNDEAFDRVLQERVAALRREQVDRFDDDALAWMAVVPSWTERLAVACQFPSGDWSMKRFVEQATAAGLCVQHQAPNQGRLWQQIHVIVSIAPYLSEPVLRQVFEQVCLVPQERTRAQALARLAPYLPSDLVRESLSQVRTMRHDRTRARALAELAPHLPEPLLWDGLDAARALDDPADRAGAVSGLATALPEQKREAVLTEALLDAQLIDETDERAAALVTLAPHLPEARRRAVLPSALEAVLLVGAEQRRAELLTMLAPYLDLPLAEAALAAVTTGENAEARGMGLVALASRLPEPTRAQYLRQALTAVGDLDDPTTRAIGLGGMVDILAGAGSVDAALQAAEAIDDEQVRTHALGTVAGVLAEGGARDRATEVATRILESGDRAKNISTVSGIAERLVGVGEHDAAAEVATKALSVSQGMPGRVDDVVALRDVAQALAGAGQGDRATGVVSRALDAARRLPSELERSEALLSLAPYLPAEWRSDELNEARAAAEAIDDPLDRVQQLINLLPHLAEEERQAVAGEVLAMVESGGDELSFWMPERIRLETLEELRHRRGPTFVAQTAIDVAARLQQVRGQVLPPRVARWAELAERASELGVGGLAAWLNRRIDELSASGATGQALGLVDAAAALAPVLGGELEATALLGRRRVELLHRQAQDKQHLRSFLERDEQIRDFERLLDHPEDGWALHYIGMGGVGKTMLLRHITAVLAPERGIPTSRVDFDHISPDYPVRRPGQLLLELADELRVHATSHRQEKLFGELQARLVQLHERLDDRSLEQDPLAAVHGPEFDRVLRAFGNLLQLLPQPVLLILDTCEELAKLRPAGATVPAVEATFSILERMHDQVPSLRVVFAGRRLLAQSGFRWRIDQSSRQEGTALLPAHKEYLRLHDIAGFTDDEATTFLTRNKQLTLAEPLRHAILARSLETGTAAPVNWDEPRAADDRQRYNPFDLALYADWVREVPNLNPAMITSGHSDQYVEVRIVGRLHHRDIQLLMPAVALLGRFDRDMLRPAFPGNEEAFAEAYRELGSMEWIDYQVDEALQTAFLEVERNLQPRLLAYYREPGRRHWLEEAGYLLGRGIAALVEQRPLGRLGVDHVDAALRLLPPDQAARFWDGLELRVAAEAAWDWARTVAERVLGQDGAVSAPDHPARPGVLATYCAALGHQQRLDVDVAGLWAQVEAGARAHPDEEIGRWLRHRAVAGQVAATRSSGRRLPDMQLANLESLLGEAGDLRAWPADERGRARAEQLGASVCAAVEAVLEDAEDSDDASRVPSPGRISAWVATLAGAGASPALTVLARTLAARALALTRRWNEVATALDAAVAGAAEAGRTTPPRWSDWNAPASLVDRVRLEAIHALPPDLQRLGADQLRSWQREAAARLDLIDAERLLSAVLGLRLARGVVPADELEALASAERYLPDRRPSCNVHRRTPSLFTAIAQGWLALGDGERALALLDERLDQAVRTGRDQATIRAAQLAKLEVVRRLRMAGREPTLLARLTGSADPDEAAASWPVLALTRPPDADQLPRPRRDDPPATVHAWWRSQVALTERSRRRAIDGLLAASGRASPSSGSGPGATISVRQRTHVVEQDGGFDELCLALDWAEAARLSDPRGRLPDLGIPVQRWFAAHPTQTEQMARLALRGLALGMDEVAAVPLAGRMGAQVERADAGAILQQWAGPVGWRRMAELALDEGELLALRDPQAAARLLDLAYQWFLAAGDPAGALIAWTRQMIAVIHGIAAQGPKARATVDRRLPQSAWPLYERLAGSGQLPGLPSWSQVLDLAASTDQPVPVEFFPSSWQGWGERLVSCLRWSAWPSGGPGDALAARRDGGLPIELAWRQADEPVPQPRRRRPTTRRRRRTLLALLGLWILLSIVGGAVYWSWLEIPRFLAFGGLVILPIWWLSRDRVRSRLAARSQVQIEITTAPSDLRDQDQTPEIAIRIAQTRPRHLFTRSNTWEQETAASWPDPARHLQGCRAAAQTLPEPLVAALTELSERLRRRDLAVELRVDRTLQSIPWEAVLGFTTPATSIKQRTGQLRFWRAGPLERPAEQRQGVRCLCDARWGLLAERAWRGLREPLNLNDDLTAVSDAAPARVLHIVGAPIDTGAGMHLKVGGAGQPDTGQRIDALGREQGLLLRPDKLPLDRYSLVVVQEEPVGGVTRLEAEREQTADVRAWAAELVEAGAQAVVLLPAQPAEVAELAIGRLARWLSARSTNWQGLIEAIADVRMAIADATTPSNGSGGRGLLGRRVDEAREQEWSETQLELALEVTVFAPTAGRHESGG